MSAYSRAAATWAARAAALAAVVYAIWWVIDRWRRNVNPVDYSVYREGGHTAWSDALNYHHNLIVDFQPGPEGMPFTYTPFAGLLLWPTTIFGYRTGFVAWGMLMILALVAVIWLVLPRTCPARFSVALVVALVASQTAPVSQHIGIGQINLLLLLLVVLDVVRPSDTRLGRLLPPGVLIGVAAAIKLTPLLFVPYLIVAQRWRMLAACGASLAVCFGVAAVIAPLSTGSFFGYGIWHLTDSVTLGRSAGLSGNGSLSGLLMYAGASHSVATLLVIPVGALGVWAAWRADRRHGLVSAGLVVLLTACVVSPVTWMHHWVPLIPAAVVLAARPGTLGKLSAAAVFAILLGAVPGVGQELMDDSAWLWLPGFFLREGPLIAALLAVGALVARDRRPPPPHVGPTVLPTSVEECAGEVVSGRSGGGSPA